MLLCPVAVLGTLAGPQRFGVPVIRATAALGYATVPVGWELASWGRTGRARAASGKEGSCGLVPITTAWQGQSCWHGWAHISGLSKPGAAEWLLPSSASWGPGWQHQVLLVPLVKGIRLRWHFCSAGANEGAGGEREGGRQADAGCL